MKRRAPLILLFILAVCALSFSKKEDSLEQLMAKADTASGGEQADLCMEVAERELKLTTNSYKANAPEDARASLQQIVKYSDKARTAAIQSGKKMKHTEIKIRRISERLRDLKFNVEADDQPGIQTAIDKLEDFRTEILKNMFGSKPHD
jgi:hypothetical protein